jgi:oxygen-dependent protoporphyrinogen oxidase
MSPSPLSRRPERVAVVGGGITGLAAAHRLRTLDPEVEVVVLEAAPRLGGRIHTEPLADWPVDAAADAFLARVPEAVALCHELGLADRLTTPAEGSAQVWADGVLRRLPVGLVLGVPTDLDALAASGIVSPAGVARAAEDLDRPDDRPPEVAAGGDESVGALVRRRLGDEVFERLVAPLLGGVNAGDADHLSLAAGAPQLERAARRGGSLVAALREQAAGSPAAPAGGEVGSPASGAGPTPVFHGLDGGTATLVEALHAALPPGSVRTGVAVHGLWPVSGGGYRLALTHPTTGPGAPPSLPERLARLDVDAVVLATPAPATARILGPHPELAEVVAGLEALTWASVAMVALVVRRDDVAHPLDASGYLVPASERRTVTACSFASTKWAHLGDGERAVLRASAGHAGDHGAALALDDTTLVARVLDDLGRHIGLSGRPEVVRVSRWPDSLPQYRPGHLEAAAAWQERTWAALPGVWPTGASFGGLGIPACVRQGEAAARLLVGETG